MRGPVVRVGRYELPLDRLYDAEHHLWVLPLAADRVRVGLDPVGLEVNGTLAQLILAPVGTAVRRGDPFGSLEAAKYVGPLVAPVSGRVAAHNSLAVGDPAEVERDPFGAGWLVELETTAFAAERSYLLEGPDQVASWLCQAVEDYRRKGVLAE